MCVCVREGVREGGGVREQVKRLIWPGVGYKLIQSLVLEAGSFLPGDESMRQLFATSQVGLNARD